jgi:hypothetical protein
MPKQAHEVPEQPATPGSFSLRGIFAPAALGALVVKQLSFRVLYGERVIRWITNGDCKKDYGWKAEL